MDNIFKYTFPAIRGLQAGREFYTSMFPMELIPKLFVYNEEDLSPELRAQRILNKSRLPEMANYLLENRKDYIFSAITVSIDSELEFETVSEDSDSERIGMLHVPMSARFIVNDGQHRQAAIQMALKVNPDIGYENIAVVFFQDIGLKRCQQMFADLNRYAIRPSKSIGVLYDHRDDLANITKIVVFKTPLFSKLVDLERSSLSMKSAKLFTLSSIYSANSALLQGVDTNSIDHAAEIASEFWIHVCDQFDDWKSVRDRKISAGRIRQDYIHGHATALQAIAKIGNSLISSNDDWKPALEKLRNLDWKRSNTDDWEGRAMVGGRISKANYNVTLTANRIKTELGLELTSEDLKDENKFLAGETNNNGKK